MDNIEDIADVIIEGDYAFMSRKDYEALVFEMRMLRGRLRGLSEQRRIVTSYPTVRPAPPYVEPQWPRRDIFCSRRC